jgi:sugar lactone lactonase YvrE
MTLKRIQYLIFFFTILFFSLSCALFNKPIPEEHQVFFPEIADTAHIQFLTSFSNSGDIQKKQSKFIKFVTGEEQKKEIKKPYGVFIKEGKIYVCDTDMGGLEIIDLKEGTFRYFVPEGPGRLLFPLNCFVDDDENLFVTDGKRSKVFVFDKSGNYKKSFGEKDNFKPIDLAVSGNKIFVTNSKSHQILVYDKTDFRLINAFPDIDKNKEGYLFNPLNLAVTNDKVYVSDFGDFKIKVFSHEGDYLSSVGSYGKNLGQFIRPKGIAVDKDMNLLVADAAFENVQMFNSAGQLLMHFGGPYQGPGYMYLPAQVTVDYNNIEYFHKYTHEKYKLKYIILVSNQYGPEKISIYGRITPKE